MSTTICFIRHGRTYANIFMTIQGRVDNPLSDEGKLDALNVGDFINEKKLQFDVVISSPLSRAFTTAQIVCERIGLKTQIITNELLVEREFGEADGLPISPENYQKIFNNSFRGMETDFELCNRSKKALDEIITNYPNKTILVVAHSHFIKSLFMQYDKNVRFDTTFGHRSINILEYQDGKIIACHFNITK